MLESVGALITAIKNAGPPIYGAAFIATSLLLFLPKPIIDKLGLIDFRESYRTYAGAVLVASGSLLAVYVISAVAGFVLVLWEDLQLRREGRKKLAELTRAEKQFLRPFILNDQNSSYAPISDGVAKGLELKKLIYRASSVSAPGGNFPYNLQPYARRLLKEHPDLLE